MNMDYPIVRIAHRGASKLFPENTLLAFRKAIEQGVDYIEMDLHLSKDREIVIIHDETLDRTTNGTGFVWDLTLDELRRYDAGRGERIPTLAEVVDLVRPTPVRLCLELKFELERSYTDKYLQEGLAVTEAAIQFLDRVDFKDGVILVSFSPILLKRAKELEPRYPLIFDPSPQDGSLTPKQVMDQVLPSRANIVAYHYSACDEAFMEESRLCGIPTWAWDPDDPDEIRRLVRLRVHGLESNRPDVLTQVLSELKFQPDER
ncbi:MAG TPA: glycerophosphodiester phosphodiesterase family protein [Anaerolineales bacterium]|nr:glycerophosphodiester phosphodiesterase family protein [Anaerolineales bacterium]